MVIERLTAIDGILHTEIYERIMPEYVAFKPFSILNKAVVNDNYYEVILKFFDIQNTDDTLFLSNSIKKINSTNIEQKLELTNYSDNLSQFT